MNESFVKIDLHGLRQDEAMKVIDKAIMFWDVKKTKQLNKLYNPSLTFLQDRFFQECMEELRRIFFSLYAKRTNIF